ncbi:MAG: PKD domain-containing protein [Nanobdellota archaeon]
MKLLPILISVFLVLTLTSCSMIEQYIPGIGEDDNESASGPNIIDLEDPFTYTNESEDESPAEENAENETEQETTPENAILSTVEVVEGEMVDLSNIKAEDPDGDLIEFSYSKPLDEKGIWETEEGDEGQYIVNITASDGVLKTTEKIRVIVNPSNKAPVIDCPDSFEVTEGEVIDLPCTIYDKEGDDVEYTVSGFMDSLTTETDYKDAGEYEVTIEATDGKRTAVKTIDLTINNKNRAPEIKPLETIKVEEGETIELDLDVEDPDGDSLSIDYPSQFDEDGRWQTTDEDVGSYELEATVSDGENEVTVPIDIVIEEVNQPPVIKPIEDITVDEGETITLEIDVTDEDSEDVEVTISGFMNSSEYTTTYEDAGEHEVTITAKDEESTVTETITITVNNVNRPPVFVGI